MIDDGPTPTRPRLILATQNGAKLIELRRLLVPSRLVTVSMTEMGVLDRAEKSSTSSEESARRKAEAVSAKTGIAALGEETSLEVDALGAFPGPISQEWLGRDADDAQRIRGLLEMARATGDVDLRARFVTTLALAIPGRPTVIATGVSNGRLIDPPRGAHGFGYDPAFQPAELDVTLAEATEQQRDFASPRARAVRALIKRGAFEGLDA